MAIQQQALKYGQRRLLRRAARSLPWIGAAVALFTLGSAIRRKGFLGGTFDCALNAIPYVGGMKNAAEVVRGRDFIQDRIRMAAPGHS
jgi:hypothetical protein